MNSTQNLNDNQDIDFTGDYLSSLQELSTINRQQWQWNPTTQEYEQVNVIDYDKFCGWIGSITKLLSMKQPYSACQSNPGLAGFSWNNTSATELQSFGTLPGTVDTDTRDLILYAGTWQVTFSCTTSGVNNETMSINFNGVEQVKTEISQSGTLGGQANGCSITCFVTADGTDILRCESSSSNNDFMSVTLLRIVF